MSNSNLTNHCIHCGHELPEGASFCPYCETQQSKTVPAQAPRRKQKLILALVLAALTIAVIMCILIIQQMPKTYQGTSKVRYPVGGKPLDIMASFDASSGENGHVIPEYEVAAPAGAQEAHPLWLCAYSSEDSSLVQEFETQIESCSIEAVPVAMPREETESSSDTADAGEKETVPAPMTVYGPDPVGDPSFPALWKADLIYSPENGINDLKWTITMKNGDQILLSQRMTCTQMPVVDLHYQETPLETTDDIKAAIASVGEDTVLNLYLPPVTYTEPLDLSDRCANLFGTSDSDQTTTFSAPITVSNRIPDMMTISGLHFAGNGGTAILAKESVFIEKCSFTGWEIGVDAVDGSWPAIESCTFDKNQIGFRFNSSFSSASSEGCYDTVFSNNGIGAYLIRVPGDADFRFVECTFEGNEEDVKKDQAA